MPLGAGIVSPLGVLERVSVYSRAMQNRHIDPEVNAFTQFCERLLGFVQGNGKLSALEVPLLPYDSHELLNHLTSSHPRLITTCPPSLPTPKNAPTNAPITGPFADSPPK